MRKKFDNWCIKKNKEAGRGEKLQQSDKVVSAFFFGMLPKLLMFLLMIALAMRGYEKYGIERTMIVISWILIYSISQNLASIRKMNKVMLQNQLEFFKNYDERKKK